MLDVRTDRENHDARWLGEARYAAKYFRFMSIVAMVEECQHAISRSIDVTERRG
jgi:hypothetical protein